MANAPTVLKQKLISILRDDYEECRFYLASTNMLLNKLKSLNELLEQDAVEFERLRNEIGEIGIYLSNSEKRLEEVEECYTKLVEALADGKPEG